MDEALAQLAEKNPRFKEELRERMVPFWNACKASGKKPWLYDPELRKAAMSIGEWLLEKGLSPNIETSPGGNTILHETVELGDDESVREATEWLLQHGADPNLPRDDGETPYTLAMRAGHQSVAEVMRNNGAKSP